MRPDPHVRTHLFFRIGSGEHGDLYKNGGGCRIFHTGCVRPLLELCDGTGVPRDSLKAIFQPFFRVYDSRSTTTGGLGLGFAIAECAIRAHHGSLWAENAEPGLRVCLDLPVGRSVISNRPASDKESKQTIDEYALVI